MKPADTTILMMFDLDNFVADPTVKELESLKKSNIIKIAQHYSLETKSSMVKHTLFNIVAQHIIDEQLGGEDFRKLDLNEEQDIKIKLKELEIRAKELDLEESKLSFQRERLDKECGKCSDQNFDPSRVSRLVPIFREEEVDQYFIHFEKVATNLQWPQNCWTSLLQTAFVGKARTAYNDIPCDSSGDYNFVKQTILKAYELVPEAYRQQFRNCTMAENETHVEFIRKKERLFERWLQAKNIGNDYEKLRHLLLIEEFKRCVHPSVTVFIEEQDICDIYDAATRADSYSLTHKLSNSIYKPHYDNTHYVGYKKNFRPRSGRNMDYSGDKPESGSDNRPPIQCTYCNMRGHTEVTCYRKSRFQSKASPSQCVAVKSRIANSKHVSSPGTVADDSKVQNSVAKYNYDDVENDFSPFLSDGFVSCEGGDNKTPIHILRDTGASRSLLLKGTIDLPETSYTGQNALIRGVDMVCISLPLHTISLECDLVTGPVIVGVMPSLPCEGISLLLGNDLCGGKVTVDPVTCITPLTETDAICGVVTRSAAVKQREAPENHEFQYDLEDTFLNNFDEEIVHLEKLSCSREKLIVEQNADETLKSCYDNLVSIEEMKNHDICYYVKDGVLMRKYRPPDARVDEEWRVIHQIILPQRYRHETISVAHDIPLAGHMGVNKTNERILSHFFWPGIRRSVAEFCKTCHACQVVGKPNQKIKRAPLHPIPAFEEPFSKIIIDCVGPLPKTRSGNEYLLTIMCSTTRFPEAIPMRNIKAKNIVSHLIKFFTLFGLPKVIQSDLGSNFTSNVFNQVVNELEIKHYTSSAYHPESQGVLERFHQTLKNMMRTYCFEQEKNWDESVHLLLFATREAVQESLGFSPFQLIFGHTVRGPLKMLKEQWLNDEQPKDLLTYVCTFKARLQIACELANANLTQSQVEMKRRYDKDSKVRSFSPGDKVLLFLPVPGEPLSARYYGPYEIESQSSELNYIVKTPDRRKQRRLCHVNMIKQYHTRDTNGNDVINVQHVNSVGVAVSVTYPRKGGDIEVGTAMKLILMTNPVLVTANYDKQFTLYVDASDVGAGAVLTQCDTEGVYHPISFFSKKFNKHQRNYATVEKECYSLVLAIQHFDVYINVTKFPVVVYTDHNPLTFINRMKNKNQMILRWSLIMQSYNLDIRHIKGKDNILADALSRVE